MLEFVNTLEVFDVIILYNAFIIKYIQCASPIEKNLFNLLLVLRQSRIFLSKTYGKMKGSTGKRVNAN